MKNHRHVIEFCINDLYHSEWYKSHEYLPSGRLTKKILQELADQIAENESNVIDAYVYIDGVCCAYAETNNEYEGLYIKTDQGYFILDAYGYVKANRYLNRIEKAIGRPSLELIQELAFADLNGFPYGLRNKIIDTVMDYLYDHGKPIDEYDRDYPDNPYKYGFELDGEKYFTGYTGVADAWWREDCCPRICY